MGTATRDSAESNPQVAKLLASADVWDMTLPWTPEHQNLEILARYRRAGFTFVSATVQNFPATFSGVQECIERCKEALQRQQWLSPGLSLDDIDRGRQEGKLVIGFNLQDAAPLGTALSRVEELRGLGVRHMLLAYNTRNLVADGCAESSDAGLSRFGRKVVREMNRVGLVVDGSHTGRRSTLEAIDVSEKPTIFSHSNPYALCAHIRNIHDEQIKACARAGGVIGIVGIGAFLGDPLARTETMFRHIDYVTQLVGPEHVGIGSDYCEDMNAVWQSIREQKDEAWPDPTGTQLYEGGCIQPEQLSDLVGLMLEHGYSDAAVQGILGRNFRRVYAAASRDLPRGQEET